MDVTIIVLCGLVIYLTIVNAVEKQLARKNEEKLLNRLMARDFSDYARHTKELEQEIAPIVQREEQLEAYPVD